ncbi:MAG TPA: 30S ribosomal protein S3 [Fusobacteria bacterium]|nr:30S ribosomal protein S3 [Fusobacteriota bacterium]|tara:strand:+ start:26842 stop:27492 length:651 start_codon:yes stop_codon:yes gene_type:complete
MGQKVDPRSMRLGINREHDSNWFANKKNFANYLHEDLKIRNFIEKKYRSADVARVHISRDSKDKIDVSIFTYKAGMILGRKGEGVDQLKKELSKFTKKKIDINVKELRSNTLNARVIGLQMAQAIERRTPFKKAMNHAIIRAKKNNVNGIKVSISGRLNGAEIARTETVLFGKVPLHSLKYDIDFAKVEADTISGVIGIKIWLSHGIKKEAPHVNA